MAMSDSGKGRATDWTGHPPVRKVENLQTLQTALAPDKMGYARARGKCEVLMDEAEIRESLLARMEKAGTLDAAGRDMAEMYLDARKRMAVAREQGETRQAQAELVTMARLMTMMGIAPESRRRAALEKEISEQLEAKHLQGPVFDDWKNRFLILWDSFQAADKCLKERGRSYIAMSAAGNKYEKDNSASKEIIALSRAMHDALQAMDITVTGYTDPDDDEL